MKRDWDLIRMILLSLEEADGEHRMSEDMGVYPANWVAVHMKMLESGGLIAGEEIVPMSGDVSFLATSITWNGREFIDSIRSDSIWDKSKGILKEKGIGLTVDTIKAAVVAVVANLLK